MTSKQQAIEYAKDRAKRWGEPYYIIKARNGQWMVERKNYVDSAQGLRYYPPT